MNDLNFIVTPKIKAIAEAIAFAEGYGIINAIPTTHNNPGDLVGPDGQKIHYDTVVDGWAALYHQIHLMVTGLSRYYKPEMTWEEIGKTYDGEAAFMNWVNSVTRKLEVLPTSTLQQYIDA